MNKFFISFMVVLFLLTGCAQKKNPYAKPTDILHEQALTQTQKVVIKNRTKTEVFFVVTYLNKIDQNLIEVDELMERFIVSAYVPSDGNESIYGNLIYEVNSKDPISVTKLDSNDEQLNILATSNSWSNYYLVQAPVDSTTSGVLFEVKVPSIGSAKIEFHDKYGNLPMGASIDLKTTQTSN